MATYGELRVKVGRKPITIVELELDACANTFGVAPCTAVGSGDAKCFNTFGTCKDTPNYSKTTKTYRFCSNSALLPVGQNFFPCIEDVDIAATQLNPKGISVNASVTVTMRDFPDHDRGIDPYVSGRTYNPMAQGTFFGKLRARNQFMRNRVIRVNTGYVDADRTVVTQTRTYFIDRIEGPDANGMVKLIGKGIIAFGLDDKITVPLPTTASLASAITNTTYTGPITLQPAGVGATFPAGAGRIVIENEAMQYSSRVGDVLTISVRGDSSPAAAHAVNTAVQQVYNFTAGAKTVVQTLYDVIVNYGQVDAAYIDILDWQAEAASAGISGTTIDQNRGLIDGRISEPTSVGKIVKEICQFYGVFLWWDEVSARLRFKAVGPYGATLPVIDEDSHILTGSMSVKDLEKERITGFAHYYAPMSYVDNSVERGDCQYYRLTVNAAAESANQYDEAITSTVVSRFGFASTTFGTFATVDHVHSRMAAWFGFTPREYTFMLDAKDADKKTGDLVDIVTRLVQSPDGAKVPVRCIITEAQEVTPGSQWRYKAQQIKPL
jgi:hypothetical protein